MNPNIMIIIYKSNQNMNTPLYFFLFFLTHFVVISVQQIRSDSVVKNVCLKYSE